MKEECDLSQYRREVYRYKKRTLTEYYDLSERLVAFANDGIKPAEGISIRYAPEIIAKEIYRDGNGY